MAKRHEADEVERDRTEPAHAAALLDARGGEPAVSLRNEPPAAGSARATDRLANERTFLAWIRTSLALITFGFVIAKFSVWLRQLAATLATVDPAVRLPRPGASLPAGLALMAFGAVIAVLALYRHRAIDAALARGQFPDAHRMATAVAGVVVLVALALIGFLIATSRAL